jgi:hypothetical protein
MRIAICYYGLTRSTKFVYKSHIENLFEPLKRAGIHYDTFVHTWTTKQATTWNGIDPNAAVPEEGKLLNPTVFKIDDEDVFIASLRFSDYHYADVWKSLGDSRLPGHEWHPTMVLNHVCLMEAMRRSTQLCLSFGTSDYDFILYMRPDVNVPKPFPVSCLTNLGENDAAILSYKHFEGYNTNVVILPFKKCKPFADRIYEAAEFRKTQGRLVTEKYTKYILDKYYTKIHQIDFPVERVRSNGEKIETNV